MGRTNENVVQTSCLLDDTELVRSKRSGQFREDQHVVLLKRVNAHGRHRHCASTERRAQATCHSHSLLSDYLDSDSDLDIIGIVRD